MPISIYTTSTTLELPGLPAEQTFNSFPIIIGRSQSCHLVLPDEKKYVSSQHAELRESGGQISLLDTSSNGTFLNGSADRINKGESMTIVSGDTLTMGSFKLQIVITEAPASPNAAAANANDDPFADPFDESPALVNPAAETDPFDFDDTPVDAKRSDAEHERRLDEMGIGPGAWDDKDDITPVGNNLPPPPSASAGGQQSASDLSDDDWDGWLSDIPEPATPPAQVPPVAHDQHASNAETVANAIPHPTPGVLQSANDASMQTLLRAAGLNPDEFAHVDSQQLANHAGKMLKSSVQGMMLLLRSRDELKNAMRAEMTLLGPTDNNPLRFSATVEDSLQKLLTPSATSGFTDANTAIDRALRDIKIHQLAMLEATRSALHIVLSHFDPELLEKNIREKSPLAANMPVAREAKLWEQFQTRYVEIKRDALDDFSDIFGRELRKAYEQSTKRLKQSID